MGNKTKYQHAEAFCLMQYSDGKEIETLWNSRDGVTPFCISSRDGKREMRHVNWQFDRPSPGHVPKVGDRIFVDLTIEKAREYRRRFTEMHWNNPDYPMSDRWNSKEQAIEELAQADMGTGGGGAPDILVATAADVARFSAASPAPSPAGKGALPDDDALEDTSADHIGSYDE